MNSKLKTAGIIVLCALLITIPLLVTLGKKMKTQPASTATTASAVESKGESAAVASTDSASVGAQTGAVKIDGNAMMDLWTDGAPLKNELISYMAECSISTERSSARQTPTTSTTRFSYTAFWKIRTTRIRHPILKKKLPTKSLKSTKRRPNSKDWKLITARQWLPHSKE